MMGLYLWTFDRNAEEGEMLKKGKGREMMGPHLLIKIPKREERKEVIGLKNVKESEFPVLCLLRDKNIGGCWYIFMILARSRMAEGMLGMLKGLILLFYFSFLIIQREGGYVTERGILVFFFFSNYIMGRKECYRAWYSCFFFSFQLYEDWKAMLQSLVFLFSLFHNYIKCGREC